MQGDSVLEDSKKTVGSLSSELIQKTPESTDPIELERAMQEDYMSNLLATTSEFAKNNPHRNFYVVVITKNEKLMPNVFRNYFYARFSCPTPDYDQSVYAYDCKKEDLYYLWTIPTREVCHHLKNNSLEVVPEERGLLQFVLEFADGTLFNVAKTLNGEEPDSSLLIQ